MTPLLCYHFAKAYGPGENAYDSFFCRGYRRLIETVLRNKIGYVGDGGPRIVLGLDPPPLPAPNTAYFTVSVKPGSDIDAVIARVQHYLLSQHPEVRAEPKRFSLGGTEAGVVAYRVIGHNSRPCAGRRGKGGERIHVVSPTHDLATFDGYD